MKVTPEVPAVHVRQWTWAVPLSQIADQYIRARLNDPLGLPIPATFIEAVFGKEMGRPSAALTC